MSTREELEALGLTPDEIEGVLSEDDPDSKRTIGDLMDEAGTAGDEDESQDDQGEPEQEAEGDDDQEQGDGEEEEGQREEVLNNGEAGEKEAPAAPAKQQPAPEPIAPPYAVPPTVEPVENYDDAVAGLYAEKRKVDQEWNDGDLYDSEREEKQRELDKKIASTIKQQAVYEQQQAAYAAHVQHAQAVAIKSFKDAHPEYDTSRGRLLSLQDAIRAIEAEGKLSDPLAILTEADRRVVDDLGPAKGAKPAPAKGKAPHAEIPPNIGALPAASANPVDESWVAHGMRLRGDAFEAWFAGLTPAQQDAFMRA